MPWIWDVTWVCQLFHSAFIFTKRLCFSLFVIVVVLLHYIPGCFDIWVVTHHDTRLRSSLYISSYSFHLFFDLFLFLLGLYHLSFIIAQFWRNVLIFPPSFLKISLSLFLLLFSSISCIAFIEESLLDFSGYFGTLNSCWVGFLSLPLLFFLQLAYKVPQTATFAFCFFMLCQGLLVNCPNFFSTCL